jgi:hypothetical protein
MEELDIYIQGEEMDMSGGRMGKGKGYVSSYTIPKRENSTTADQLICQGKVIISHYLVGNEWAISE